MIHELRDRAVSFLSSQDVCILSTAGSDGMWAMPARYRNQGLEIDCLLPRWSDVAFYLELNPRVLVLVQPRCGGEMRWLQCLGRASPVVRPDWQLWEIEHTSASPQDLYLVIHVQLEHIDLIDESLGWGIRETLDL